MMELGKECYVSAVSYSPSPALALFLGALDLEWWVPEPCHCSPHANCTTVATPTGEQGFRCDCLRLPESSQVWYFKISIRRMWQDYLVVGVAASESGGGAIIWVSRNNNRLQLEEVATRSYIYMQVAIWFQNRRARWKTKQLEKDYDALRRQLNAARGENDVLLA